MRKNWTQGIVLRGSLLDRWPFVDEVTRTSKNLDTKDFHHPQSLFDGWSRAVLQVVPYYLAALPLFWMLLSLGQLDTGTSIPALANITSTPALLAISATYAPGVNLHLLFQVHLCFPPSYVRYQQGGNQALSHSHLQFRLVPGLLSTRFPLPLSFLKK